MQGFPPPANAVFVESPWTYDVASTSIPRARVAPTNSYPNPFLPLQDFGTLQLDHPTRNWYGIRVLRAFLSAWNGWGPAIRVALVDRGRSFFRVSKLCATRLQWEYDGCEPAPCEQRACPCRVWTYISVWLAGRGLKVLACFAVHQVYPRRASVCDDGANSQH